MIVTATGGGAKSKLWIQIKANLLNKSFIIYECNEAACIGAAMIGAKSFVEEGNLDLLIKKWVKYDEVIIPW